MVYEHIVFPFFPSGYNELWIIAMCMLNRFSHVWLFLTPWTVACWLLSMGFPRQEYWNVLPFPSPGDLPDSGIKPGSPALQGDSLPSEPPGKQMVKNWPAMQETWVQSLGWEHITFILYMYKIVSPILLNMYQTLTLCLNFQIHLNFIHIVFQQENDVYYSWKYTALFLKGPNN